MKQASKYNHGQVVVEYVLLLVVSVALATLLIKQLANRDPDNAGVITTKWHQILVEIGRDTPEK